MERKVIKFRDELATLVMSGDKTVTWRLFDDKDLGKGDVAEFVNWNTGEVFGHAELTYVREKTLGELEESDFYGHEKFESQEEMYQIYRKYYGDKVGPDTIVKIIRFNFMANIVDVA